MSPYSALFWMRPQKLYAATASMGAPPAPPANLLCLFFIPFVFHLWLHPNLFYVPVVVSQIIVDLAPSQSLLCPLSLAGQKALQWVRCIHTHTGTSVSSFYREVLEERSRQKGRYASHRSPSMTADTLPSCSGWFLPHEQHLMWEWTHGTHEWVPSDYFQTRSLDLR